MTGFLLFVAFFIQHVHVLFAETSYRYLTDSAVRVTSTILEPYMMPNPEYVYNSGLPRYIGFIPDLMFEIGILAKLDYTIKSSPDNSFGYRRNDGTWNGMIGQLLRQDADLAAGPMFYTSQRARVVDFTVPFMHVQATILLRKHTAGIRTQIRSAEDLVNQSEIVYGTLDKGIILRAFRSANTTTATRMWNNIQNFDPSTLTSSNEEGIERARRENYAFVIPHTIGEYMELQQPCDLTTVDRFLINRGYSLALSKQSHIMDKINDAIRMLDKSGKLLSLYKTWWHGHSQCPGRKSTIHHGTALASTAGAPPLSSRICSVVYMCPLFVYGFTIALTL